MIRKYYLKVKNKLKKEILILKVRFSKFQYGICNEKREIPIIISLTTFPARMDFVGLCFKSILRQTIKPDKIIVWLGSDTSEEDIQLKLSKYEKYGIEFRHDKEHDYKSYKKYMYAFKEYSNAVIITLDDDIVYPNDVVESLLKTHKKYPNAIVARRVHKITWKDNKINPYLDWVGEYQKEEVPNHMLLATTGAGTLFPPGSLPKIATDFSLIKELALTADDIWIKFMAVLNNTKVVWAKNRLPLPPSIHQSQRIALQHQNVENNMNDVYIRKIMNKFHIDKSNFEAK